MNPRCKSEKTVIAKVIPGGSGHRQMLEEMQDPDWTLSVQLRRKIPMEKLMLMDQEDAATAYAVETMIITSEDIIKPSDYPEIQGPSSKEAAGWAAIQDKKEKGEDGGGVVGKTDPRTEVGRLAILKREDEAHSQHQGQRSGKRCKAHSSSRRDDADKADRASKPTG